MSSFRRSLVVTFLVALVAGLASTVRAQDLPTDLVMTTIELSEAQIAKVRLYVEPWAAQLLAGESADTVAAARNKLLDPLKRPSAGEAFIKVYSTVVAAALTPAPRSSKPLVRLNAMVVVGMLRGPGALALAAESVDDQSTGVRYWASKAIAEGTSASAPSIDPALVQKLTEALVPAITAEVDDYVREQMYLAMGGIRSKDARDALIKVVNARLQHYVAAGLSDSLRGEVSGMQRAQQGLVIDWNNGTAKLPEVKQFVSTLAKYLRLVASAAQDPGGVPAGARSACDSLVAQADGLLPWAVIVADPQATTTGPKLLPAFKSGQAAVFGLAALEWVGTSTNPGILQRAKINIPLKDVQLPKAPAN